MGSVNFAHDAGGGPSWLDVGKLHAWAETKNVTVIGTGKRHNRTDGEIHYVYKFPNGEEFELIANCWDYRTCQSLLDALEK